MSTLNMQLLCRKSKNILLDYRYLPPDLAPWLTLSCSNYPCLEQFSMVPKMFEPLRFDCKQKEDSSLDIIFPLQNTCICRSPTMNLARSGILLGQTEILIYLQIISSLLTSKSDIRLYSFPIIILLGRGVIPGFLKDTSINSFFITLNQEYFQLMKVFWYMYH